VHTSRHPVLGIRRHARLFAALVLTLALVCTASASTKAHFSGKTKLGEKLTFRTTATQVIGFDTAVLALCSSAVTGNRQTDYHVIAFPKGPLKKNGQFTLTFKISSNGFVATAKGTVKGNSASGKLNVSYSKIIGTTSTGLMDIGACFASTTWSAKRV
jgi:hypothetical protein